MASDNEKDRTSFTGKYDLETKTARPKSVGPHDVKRDQEDPADPGIQPGTGYANEIAELNAARDTKARGPVQIKVKGGTEGEKPEGSG